MGASMMNFVIPHCLQRWINFSFLLAAEEVSVKVVIRVVEVLQNVFLRGSSGLAEHLSFLVTLLAGRTTADNNISMEFCYKWSF